MPKLIFAVSFVVMLGLVAPTTAEAQFRDAVEMERAPSKLYDSNTSGTLLNRIFSPEVFQMGHSYEMSFGSFGGNSYSLGMYTNTMTWQFSDEVAARVDVSAAFSPFNNSLLGQNNNMQVFLRNAELIYRPSENTTFHIQIRQSPYGAYASPYGHYGPYHGAYDRGSPFDR